jgi:hypothetical protein
LAEFSHLAVSPIDAYRSSNRMNPVQSNKKR